MPKSKIPTFLYSFIFLLLLGFLNLALFSPSGVCSPDHQFAGFSYPMDFSVLRKFLSRAPNTSSECQFALQGLHLVQAQYLRRSGRFLLPLETASTYWDLYQALFGEFIPIFGIRSACGFETRWISDGCMNITTRLEFEAVVPENSMVDVRHI